MIIEFETDSLRELIERGKTSDRKYRKLQSNVAFMSDFRKVFNTLYIAKDTEELKFYGRLHYEKLRGNRGGASSVRIGFSSKYRLIFTEFDGGIRIRLIEINEHYGDK